MRRRTVSIPAARFSAYAVALAALTFAMACSAQQEVTEPPAAAAELHIPGDVPWPRDGEVTRVALQPGASVHIDDPDFSLDAIEARDLDLWVRGPTGGVIVLTEALALPAPGFSLVIDGVQVPASNLAALLLSGAEPAAAPAGGGGEVFTLVNVVSWFLDRVDFTSEALAQEADGEEAGGAMNYVLLERLDLQLRIARNTWVATAAEDHLALVSRIHEEIEAGVEQSAMSVTDLQEVESHRLTAQLDKLEADLHLALAVDRHQDRFGERLESSRFPQLRYTPAADIPEARRRARLGPPDRVRLYWRQERFATESLAILENLRAAVEDLCLSRRSQFNIGRATLGNVLGACGLIAEVRTREARLRYERAQAQSWLLAAEDALTDDVLLHPGWQ